MSAERDAFVEAVLAYRAIALDRQKGGFPEARRLEARAFKRLLAAFDAQQARTQGEG